MGNASRLWCGA